MIIDIDKLASGLGVTTTGLLILLLAIGILVFVLYKDLPQKKQKQKLLLLTGAMVLVVLWTTGSVFTGGVTFNPGSPSIDVNWQESYTAEAKNTLEHYDEYVEDTEYYDYDDLVIAMVAKNIISTTSNPLEAVKAAADYVYMHVDYVAESDEKCFSSSAADVLSSGTGQCDTQSIALIAILRKMGIAAKPVGGCIIPNPSCRLQAFVKRVPQFEPLNISGEEDEFSRGAGGLHAWVVAWVPDKGWINIESTAGMLADTSCYYYHVELYPSDNNKRDICVSTNQNYAAACSVSNFEALNSYGLGLVSEVSP